MNSYKDLLVWQKGISIAVLTYKFAKSMPKEELYGLTDQKKRCSTSISSNIAEGYGRGTTKDYARFLRISRGSLYELETQFHIIKELELSTQLNEIEAINELLIEESKMLNSMIKKITKA